MATEGKDTVWTESEWGARHPNHFLATPPETINRITPYAQLCPVCDGVGVFPPQSHTYTTCHGCDGKGWVVVR